MTNMSDISRRTLLASAVFVPAVVAEAQDGAVPKRQMLAGRTTAAALERNLLPRAKWRPYPTWSERPAWTSLPAEAIAAVSDAGESRGDSSIGEEINALYRAARRA